MQVDERHAIACLFFCLHKLLVRLLNLNKIKFEFSPSSRVWTSAFAKQSASFALATTHSLDVLFNASRPYRRSPSAYFEGTHDVRSAWGNTDAIDFVAIASSLQATNGGRVVSNTNRLKAVSLVHGRKNPHSPVHLYNPSSSTLASVIALRFQFRLRIDTFR